MVGTKQRWKRSSIWFTTAVLLMLFVGLILFIWPSKVELSPDTYDIAIALYRVCNQQDDKGLQQIQAELNKLGDSDVPSIAHLQRIVDKADAGDWKSAMRDTRSILEDQVRSTS